MAIQYTISPINPIGLENFSKEDIKVVDSFKVNETFDAFQHKIELHVYGDDETLIDSIYDYRGEKFLLGSETAGTTGASSLDIDPESDSKKLGYIYGGINLVYNFLDNLYSENQKGGEFFIEEISQDRTEIRLLTNQISDEDVIRYTNKIKKDLESTSFFNEFRLNLKNNDLFIGINIDIQQYRDFNSVIIKLYEPLPEVYNVKDIVTVDRVISDTVAFSIETSTTVDEIEVPYLKGPNFNIEKPEDAPAQTSYLSYNDLFSFPTNNTYRELNSAFSEKGINLSINYSDYSNFIQFSSAEERLKNFQYKLNLIESYQVNVSKSSAIIENGYSGYMTGSENFWKDKINNILDNFDHYDRHLYYESGSTSWPKQAPGNKPYINATGSATSSFYDAQLITASNYDISNNSQLLNTIPEYLKEDPDSSNYNIFINMLGQHFDNIWVYGKALANKYDNDNRLEYGISKDLVQDTLKNFGVKIYNNTRSSEDLFRIFTGEIYQTGSDWTKEITSATDSIDSIEKYRNEIHKRLYHNLPYLLKTKGTERGLKALISSFGVPTDNTIEGSVGSINGLYVRTIGGENTSGSHNYGPLLEYTSSAGKVKTDNTGSITTGNTLSKYTSVMQRDSKYSDDVHTVEVGYSPTYPLNEYIRGQLVSGFDIDNYIGDPGQAQSGSYELLVSESNRVITQSSPHHYGEFVRVLKFYDNVLFKMIKDFVPARSNIDTGIIIKPHILERNKIKQVSVSGSHDQFTASIDTAFSSGSQGGAYTNFFDKEFEIPLTASYTHSIITPDGLAPYTYHLKERARFDGELSGSEFKISNGELNNENEWKYKNASQVDYKPALVELIVCPTVSTDGTNILADGLSIGATGSVTYSENAARGFVYSQTNTTPTRPSDTSSFFASSSSPFSMVLNNLQTGSWYIRAYAQTPDCGDVYGAVIQESLTCPSVSSLAANNITTSVLRAQAKVNSSGSHILLGRGFIFSLTSSAVVDRSNASGSITNGVTESIVATTPGQGLGGFEHNFTGLTAGSTYYYRAFASSSVCTAYGDTISATTTSGFGAQSFNATPAEATGDDVAGSFCDPMQIPDFTVQLYFQKLRSLQLLPDPGQVTYTNPGLTNINYGVHYRMVDTAEPENVILINGNGTVDSYFECDDF